MEEKYVGFMDALLEQKEWAIYQLMLTNTEPLGRQNALQNLFLKACDGDDDECAQRLFSWILRAVEDDALESVVEQKSGRKFLPSTDEVSMRKLVAKKTRAGLAMALYKRVQEIIAGNAAAKRKFDSPGPRLLQTRKCILTEVSQWWRETSDEEEADILLKFLLNIDSPFPEEKEVKTDVVKQATDFRFPVRRLTHQFLLVAPFCENRLYTTNDNIVRILANARNRNNPIKAIVQELQVIQHLEGCSEGAFNYVDKVASKIAALDNEAKELADTLNANRFDFPTIPSFSFSYPEGTAYLLVTLTQKTQFDVNMKTISAEENRRFEHVCSIVRVWAKKRIHSVKVQMFFKKEFPSDSKPQLFRSDHF